MVNAAPIGVQLLRGPRQSPGPGASRAAQAGERTAITPRRTPGRARATGDARSNRLGFLINARNSPRVRASSRKTPSIALVTATEFCFSTPRIIMHRCVASITTATPCGCDLLVHRLGDLGGQPLLHLQAAREHVDQAGDLAQADHLPLRQVGDVALAEKRQQVMLAQAVEVDVLDDHHLVIIDSEQCVVEHRVDVGGVAARQELQRLLDALRRVEQPLAGRIFAELGEQPPNDILHRCYSTFAARPRCRPPPRPRRPTRPRRALRATRDDLASARAAEAIWAQRLNATRATSRPRGSWRAPATGSGVTLPSANGRRCSRPASPPAAPRWRSKRTAPKDTSGWPPTWARSPNRSAPARV